MEIGALRILAKSTSQFSIQLSVDVLIVAIKVIQNHFQPKAILKLCKTQQQPVFLFVIGNSAF